MDWIFFRLCYFLYTSNIALSQAMKLNFSRDILIFWISKIINLFAFLIWLAHKILQNLCPKIFFVKNECNKF